MPPKLRTITFVDRITFDFKGNVAQNAVCLADVDNDGEVELVVGNSAGELAIFKGTGSRPWRVSAVKLGHIAAICAGDLLNLGGSVLVVISADGFINMFDCSCMAGIKPQMESGSTPPPRPAPPNLDSTSDDGSIFNTSASTLSSAGTSAPSTPAILATTPQTQNDSSSSPQSTPSSDKVADGDARVFQIIPIFKQRIPANVKSAMIVDTNGNGFKELVVTLTDRVVRTYQWHHTGDIISTQAQRGHLMPRHKWEFASQVGSTSIHSDDRGRPVLLISQPGGAFIRLRVPGRRPPALAALDDDDDDDDDADDSLKVVHCFEPLVVSNLRNCNVSTEILGEFATQSSDGDDDDEAKNSSMPFAIATLDGNLIFAKNEELLWSLQVNQQLFCLNKMDLDDDGREELVVSSWDGHTYIVTQDCRAVEFVFEESVLAFTCGRYTVEDETVPVFVYVTCNGKIFVYYNIALPKDVEMTTLPEDLMLSDTISATPDLTRFLLYAPFSRMQLNQNRGIN